MKSLPIFLIISCVALGSCAPQPRYVRNYNPQPLQAPSTSSAPVSEAERPVKGSTPRTRTVYVPQYIPRSYPRSYPRSSPASNPANYSGGVQQFNTGIQRLPNPAGAVRSANRQSNPFLW